MPKRVSLDLPGWRLREFADGISLASRRARVGCTWLPCWTCTAVRWWAGNPLSSHISYLQSYADWLIDYGKRYRQRRPVSTGGVASAVEYVVDQRMKNKGHMRWSRQGANALLQGRCAVLNGIDMLKYPRHRKCASTAPPQGA